MDTASLLYLGDTISQEAPGPLALTTLHPLFHDVPLALGEGVMLCQSQLFLSVV